MVGLLFLLTVYAKSPPPTSPALPAGRCRAGILHSKSDSVGVKIQRGEGLAEITKKLETQGVIKYPFGFRAYAIITDNGRKIKAGYYIFKRPSGMITVLKTLTQGKSVDIKVTIPEGITLKETARLLQDKLDIDIVKFIKLTKDTSYIRSICISGGGGKGNPAVVGCLEGYLFPETYLFSYREEPKIIIERLVKEFFKNITPEVRRGIEESKFSLEEIITLASLIEEEAMVDSEKPIIAGVYYNRLKKGMPLQCDPTVQYILPEHKANLNYSDLKVESPYNTYLHKGLPPGPICSPRRSSILAAVFPAKTSYLYFVSAGRTHIFSRTNKEHMEAKFRSQNSEVAERN